MVIYYFWGDIVVIYAHDKVLFRHLNNNLTKNNCRVINKLTENAGVTIADRQLKLSHDAGILLVNSQNLPVITGGGKVDAVLSCGMNQKDSLTFSAIDRETALLCLQRDVPLGDYTLQSGEFPVKYFPELSVYHNIAMGFCSIIQQI